MPVSACAVGGAGDTAEVVAPVVLGGSVEVVDLVVLGSSGAVLDCAVFARPLTASSPQPASSNPDAAMPIMTLFMVSP